MKPPRSCYNSKWLIAVVMVQSRLYNMDFDKQGTDIIQCNAALEPTTCNTHRQF